MATKMHHVSTVCTPHMQRNREKKLTVTFFAYHFIYRLFRIDLALTSCAQWLPKAHVRECLECGNCAVKVVYHHGTNINWNYFEYVITRKIKALIDISLRVVNSPPQL